MKSKLPLIGLLLLGSIIIAACGTPAAPQAMTDRPAATDKPTLVPLATAVPTPEPAVEPTIAPTTVEQTVAPTAEPTAVPEPEAAYLTLTFSGLAFLGPDFVYEGWLIVDDTPVSTGVFTVDEQGMPSETTFAIDPETLAQATTFVLTIEPVPDPDAAPSAGHYLAGDFDGRDAVLTVAHPDALGDDFLGVTGTFLLGIPTSDSPNDSYRSGIWFTGLNLPALPAGWIYEGWVVGAEGPLSTGRFTDAKSADSDGAGPTSGPKAGPAFPGQDYIDPPMDLTLGYTAVISIEPDPDDSPAPFALKLLVGEIVDAGDHGTQTMDNDAASFPTGTAAR